jgi:ABC-type branched-subunit amino acid transport system ATPase component
VPAEKETCPKIYALCRKRHQELPQQQLAIARAPVTKPKLLILDEPTQGIQSNIIDRIGETTKLLRYDEITVLPVE